MLDMKGLLPDMQRRARLTRRVTDEENWKVG
jgi:hypothetical protein